MIRFFFNQLSLQRKVDYLRKKGIVLGTRVKAGRLIYIYMFANTFVEVVFRNDDIKENPESVNVISGLRSIREYLKRKLKASYA